MCYKNQYKVVRKNKYNLVENVKSFVIFRIFFKIIKFSVLGRVTASIITFYIISIYKFI